MEGQAGEEKRRVRATAALQAKGVLPQRPLSCRKQCSLTTAGLGLRDMSSLGEAQPTFMEPCVIGKG